MQCLLCYDTSNDAITLPCGNVACIGCLLEDFDDNSLFCQLCLKNHIGDDLHSLQNDETDCLDTTTRNEDNTKNGGNKLMINAPPDVTSGWMQPSLDSPFIKCSFEGCSYRALCGDWCYTHIPSEKRRGSLSLTDESAKSLANTSLAMIANELTPSPSSSGSLESGTAPSNRFSGRLSPSDGDGDAYQTSSKDTDASSGPSSVVCTRASAVESCTPLSIFARFHRQERLTMVEAVHVLEASTALLTTEPNVMRLRAPLVAVGDLHGQFYDLCHILQQFETSAEGLTEHVAKEFSLTFEFLKDSSQQLLFLGDYVDRGSFSCEVMLGLLALKLAFPKQIHLIRGNHECLSLTHHFGFREECKGKYGVVVYHLFCSMFKALPLAATVQTDFGTLFACHGGLSPSIRTLADIENINRYNLLQYSIV